MFVENVPLQVVSYSEYLRLRKFEDVDFDPNEKITVFVVTKVLDGPGVDKDRYYSTMSRTEAEQVLASLKTRSGHDLGEDNKTSYHWEIEEMAMTAGVYSEFHFAFNSCLRWRATLTKYPDGSVIGSKLTR